MFVLLFLYCLLQYESQGGDAGGDTGAQGVDAFGQVAKVEAWHVVQASFSKWTSGMPA